MRNKIYLAALVRAIFKAYLSLHSNLVLSLLFWNIKLFFRNLERQKSIIMRLWEGWVAVIINPNSNIINNQLKFGCLLGFQIGNNNLYLYLFKISRSTISQHQSQPFVEVPNHSVSPLDQFKTKEDQLSHHVHYLIIAIAGEGTEKSPSAQDFP